MSKTTLEKVFCNKYVQLAALAAGGLALLRNWKKDSISGIGRVRRSGEPFDIPTIPEILRRGLSDGSITYGNAAEEMYNAGYFNYLPSENEIDRYLGIGKVIRSSFYEAEILSDEGNYKVIFSVIPRSGNIRAEIYQRTASYISPENYDPQKMVEWFHWGTEYGRSIEEAFNKADSFVARAGGHINLNDIKNL